MKSKVWVWVVNVILFLYVLPMICFAAYYQWQYENEHSFADSLFLGRIVPLAHAIVWPYYCFSHTDKTPLPKGESPYDHWEKSTIFLTDALKKLNKKDILLSNTSDSSIYKDYIVSLRKAYEEGLKVNIDTLNFDKPNIGNYFREEYLKGMELQIEGYDSQTPFKFNEGADSLRAWFEHTGQ